jgi:fatty-acyl-CoA synthase
MVFSFDEKRMNTILSRLQINGLRHANKVFAYFLKDEETTIITFDLLLKESTKYARRYQELGLGSTDNVILVLQHCPDLLYAFVGALLNGSIPTILPFPSTKQDKHSYWHALKEVFGRVKTRAIITYPENAAELRSCIESNAIAVLTPEEVRRPGVSSTKKNIDWALTSPDQIAFLQHTSGTTGLKKSIALSNRAVLNQIESYASVLNLAETDVIVSWLPLYHDMGLIACFILPLLRGISVVMMDPFEWVYQPAMLFEAIEKYQGSLVWLPNFSFHHLAATVDPAAPHDLASLRGIISCSEPCKPAAFRQFQATFKSLEIRPALLQTCYAMAENVFAVTQSKLGQVVRVLGIDQDAYANNRVEVQNDPKKAIELLSVGTPVPGVSIKIVDRERREAPENVIGEVAICGCSLFSGYYQLPKVTDQVLREGWYYTGDLGFLADGELYITGRIKELIIVNGKNYYPHDIEAIVNRAPQVKKGRVVALGLHNEEIGSEEIIVIAETVVPESIARQAVKNQIKTQLMSDMSLYVKDVYLVPVGWIVKTTSGKVSRAENKNKYLREIAMDRPGEQRIPA